MPIPAGGAGGASQTIPPFPNADRLVVEEFTAIAGDRWRAGGVTPSNLQDVVPFVAVRRSGGPSDEVNDYPLLTVEVFARTVAEADDIAEEIRQRLLGDFIRNSHGQMDRAICTSAHTELPAPDPALRRLVTVYRLTCRRLPVGA